MPLEKLEKRILADAWNRADAINEEARSQAEKILAGARSEVRKIESDAEKSATEDANRREAEQVEALELQERSAMLEARSKAIEGALSKLKTLVTRKVKKHEYSRLIAGAIDEAVRIAPQEELTLVISKSDAKLVKNFAGRIIYGSVGKGIELRNRNGSVRMVTTIDSLFEKNKQEIETMLLKEAFPKRKRMTASRRRKRGR